MSANAKSFTLCLTLFALFTVGGCRLPNTTELDDYSAFGGAWQRTVRNQGRVGSVFDPGGAKVAALSDRSSPGDGSEVDRSESNDDKPRKNIFEDEPDDDPNAETPPGDGPTKENSLEDIEDERSRRLRDLKLEDIEVRNAPPVGSPVEPVSFDQWLGSGLK